MTDRVVDVAFDIMMLFILLAMGMAALAAALGWRAERFAICVIPPVVVLVMVFFGIMIAATWWG